jgi:hypothetical protein
MSIQFPTVPALPGVPALARLGTAAQVAAGATTAGLTQALAAQLGLPTTVTFGPSANFSGLGLQSLTSQSSPQPDNPNPGPASLPAYGIFSTGTVSLGPITTDFSDGTSATTAPETVGSFNSSPVIIPDTVLEFEVTADSDINTHPVEPGTSGGSVGFSAYNRVPHSIMIRMLMACQGKNMPRSTFVSTLKSLREGTQVVTISSPDGSFPNMTLKRWDYKKTAEHGAVTIFADTQWQEERSTNVSVSAPPTSQPQGSATTSLGSLSPINVTAQQMAVIGSPIVPPAPLPPIYSSTAPPSGDAF